jgi:hypothetical protein
MGRSPKPKTAVIPPVRVTEEQLSEIDRRAEAAEMTRSDYVRERALGKPCAPVKK